jgi:hypothetical protein
LLCNFISKSWSQHFCNNISKFGTSLPLAKTAAPTRQTNSVLPKKLLQVICC